MTLRTSSGRLSRTMLVQILHLLIQLPILCAGLLELAPPKTAVIAAAIIAAVASVATAILRLDTVEPMRGAGDE